MTDAPDRLTRADLCTPLGVDTAWPSTPCLCGWQHPIGLDHLAVQLAELDPLRLDAAEAHSRAAWLAAYADALAAAGEPVPDDLAARIREAEHAAADADALADLDVIRTDPDALDTPD